MSVRHALLALLSEGPKYGLQLRQEFEARTGEVWPLNVGQVYTTLQRLERDGLVASDDDDEGPQKGYRITADGRRELAGRVAAHAAGGRPAATRRAADQGPGGGAGAGVDVHDVIQVHRRHLVELMQRYTAVKADAAEDDVALALVVDAELFRWRPRCAGSTAPRCALRRRAPAGRPTVDRRPGATAGAGRSAAVPRRLGAPS